MQHMRLFCPTRLALLLLTFAAFASAQPPRHAATGKPPSPAIHLKESEVSYSKTANSLSEIDFRNLDYFTSATQQEPVWKLRQGKFSSHEAFSFEDAAVSEVWRFGKTATEPGFALIYIQDVAGGGSSNDSMELLLFTLKEGRLTLLQTIEGDEQALGAGAVFNPATRQLIVKLRSNDDSPHCCPKNLDLVHLKWTGNNFAVAETHRIPVK